MARPRKHLHEQRTASIRIGLTEAEKLYVQEQADRADLCVTEYARFRLLNAQVRTSQARVNAHLLHQLNQLALQLQKLAAEPPSPPQASAISRNFSELLDTLALNEH